MRTKLATFDDRWTMRHVHFYRQPCERVWSAITTSEDMDVWLLPVTQVEKRLGGRCSFSWGGDPVTDVESGTVDRFDPPRVVRYKLPESTLQFELSTVSGGTRLTMIHAYDPAFRQDPSTIPRGDEGGDLPAGPDTPWRPGFVAGFHEFLDRLGDFLADRWGGPPGAKDHAEPTYDELVIIYRAHIREHCPPPRPTERSC